jgi:hypothetical protein
MSLGNKKKVGIVRGFCIPRLIIPTSPQAA